jgi:hypothetical protein
MSREYIVNVVPRPSSLSARMKPPDCLTIP